MLKNEEIVKIVEEYQDHLFLYCVSKVKDKYDADDILSEVIFALWSKKDELKNDNIKAWLYRSVNIQIKRHFRSKQKYWNRNKYIDTIDEYNLPYISDNEYVTEHIERIDEKILEYIKHQLPVDQQELFQYRYIENLSLSEISDKMNSPYSTTVHRNQKLTKKIRVIMNEYLK